MPLLELSPGARDCMADDEALLERNRGTAKLYDSLGLPEFYALEGFVQWRE